VGGSEREGGRGAGAGIGMGAEGADRAGCWEKDMGKRRRVRMASRSARDAISV
jgi:hypothetical protein